MANLRQKKAVEILVEARRTGDTRKTMGQILREAGYSDNTAIKPSQVTDSLGWQEMMEQYVPDEMLATIGLNGLAATKRDVYTGEVTNDWQTIFKFWQDFMDRKHPKVTKAELTGKDGLPLFEKIEFSTKGGDDDRTI